MKATFKLLNKGGFSVAFEDYPDLDICGEITQCAIDIIKAFQRNKAQKPPTDMFAEGLKIIATRRSEFNDRDVPDELQ